MTLMKKLICAVTLCAVVSTSGQGTFLFDQQSSTDETIPAYGSGTDIHLLLPSTGQSFTPALSGISFVRFMFDDGTPGDGQGATLYVNLRSQSIIGPILGTTAPVAMPDGFAGTANFLFPSTISLTPSTQYYLELVLTAGMTPWNVQNGPYDYPGGIGYAQGQPHPGVDYWFREGIYVVPEPSAVALGVGGIAALAYARRKSNHFG